MARPESRRARPEQRGNGEPVAGSGGSRRAPTRPRRRGERAQRWWFWAVAYTTFVLLAGTNLPTPLYQGYQRDFGFSPLVLTLVFASYIAALVPSLLVVGPLSDAVGRRRVLVPAVAVAIVGSGLFALADDTSWLFAARIVQGLAVGAASGALTAALVELEPAGDRRRAALVAAMAPVTGIAVGPLLSGLLAEYAPAGHATPYLVEIALLVPAVLAVIRAPDPVRRTRWRLRRPHIPTPIRAAFAASATVSFLAWSVTGLFLALVPSYVATLTGVTNLALSGGVVTLMLGCSVVAQRLAAAQDARSMQTRGLGGLALGLVLLVVAGASASLALLLAATVVAGVGHGVAFLGAMTEVNRIAPPERRSEVVSGFLVATYLGTGVPVIGAGFLATLTGLLTAVQLFSVVAALGCLLALAASTRRHSPPRCIRR